MIPPPPLALFQKSIRFGSGILPLYIRCIVQMVGRGEEVEGEGLTLAQFMGTYYR